MIVAVYKKRGITSRKLINQIKNIVREKKVGHAGTLDPLASGILVVGLGRESTKKLHTPEFYEKEYKATIKLGEESNTDDEEGEKTDTNKDNKVPSLSEVQSVVNSFIGEIEQIPPQYSAIKINGKEAYKYARQGKSVKIPSRKVSIKEIKITKYQYPFLEITVTSSKGVYIRSLAKDVGRKLKTGGYLHNLERTRVGNFKIDNCVDLSFFENIKNYDKINKL